MQHYGSLRDFHFTGLEDIDDIRDADVYGLNGEKLGEIEDVIFDHQTGQIRYVVVDTGGWLKSRKFLVPADRVRPYGEDNDDFAIDLSKERIESFPAYKEEMLESQEKWRAYESRYEKAWAESPVQHREGTDRNITPAPSEISIEGGADLEEESEISMADLTPERLAGKFPGTYPEGGKLTMRPAGTAARAEDAAHTIAGIGGRWSKFENNVRRNLDNIRSGCKDCGIPESRKIA